MQIIFLNRNRMKSFGIFIIIFTISGINIILPLPLHAQEFNLDQARERFLEIKQELEGKTDDQISEGQRAELLQRGKDFLSRIYERAIQLLIQAQEQVQNTSTLNEEQKAELIQKLQAVIDDLTKQGSEIPQKQNFDEMKNMAQIVQEQLQNSRRLIMHYKIVAMHERFNVSQGNIETIDQNLQKDVDILEKQGKDVSQLRKRLADFQSNFSQFQNVLHVLNTQIAQENFATTEFSQTQLLSDLKVNLLRLRGIFREILTEFKPFYTGN